MRNLVINIYCSRDRNTKKCLLHDSARRGNTTEQQVNACIKCQYSIIDYTAPGRALAERGLPRLSPSMDLSNYEE